MALSDIAIRNAKSRPKPFKLADSGGLFLLVTPAGGKLWRLKYRIAGKEGLLAIGAYPDVSLNAARKARDNARELMAAGGDPALEKRRDKARSLVETANTFEAVAKEYFDKRKRDGDKPWAESTVTRNNQLLGQLNPVIGKMPVNAIMPADVLGAVRRIEAKGNLESARRALQLAGGVLRYAVATARLASDPTRDLRGALRQRLRSRPGRLLLAIRREFHGHDRQQRADACDQRDRHDRGQPGADGGRRRRGRLHQCADLGHGGAGGGDL